MTLFCNGVGYVRSMFLIVINIPGAQFLSTELSKNARIHRQKKARITRKHRDGSNGKVISELVYRGYIAVKLPQCRGLTATLHGEPLRARTIRLTRFAPARYSADGDNLATLLSSVRDGVADALGVNDKVFVTNPTEAQRQSGAIGIIYEQIDGPWGVRITIEPA